MPGLRHAPEVLSDGGEQELIASAVHSAQPQASQVQDAFEVSEQHLNFLSIFARLPVKTGLGDAASHIARRFIDAAGDLAVRRVRTAVRLRRAHRAIGSARCVNDRIGFGNVCTRALEGSPFATQRMALRAAVFVALFVPLEGAAGQ